ncbi:MAG TPA: peptidase S10, partial [Candidatus Angelobacter sp.]|nr:peptidase S10 [Candidatus Angelobacter sp.]
FVASGFYDLATPYFATHYTLNHIGLNEAEHQRISLGYYPAGHMMYIQDESLSTLRKDITAFINSALR